MKNLFLDPEFKLEINNYKKNIIDLDEEDGEKDGFSSVDKSFQYYEDVKGLKKLFEKTIKNVKKYL